MRIDKIYISAFGKLKDFTLELDNGLNIIYGANENGKTTIMNFIKIMFYGSGKKTQNISSNLRLKYTPWSGDTMGGRIYFEHASRRYCLEREFKKSDSTDRIVLTNLDTGEVLPASGNIGVKFFGLSQAAFERCMFIENSVFLGKDVGAEGEINSRLSNLILTGESDISYQSVVSRIENARNKIISKSGRAGLYAKLSADYENLNQRLSDAEKDAARRYELNETLSKLKSEYESLNKDYLKVQKILGSEKDIKNAEKLKEFISIKESIENLKKELTLSDGSIADNMFINKINFCLSKLEKHQNRIDEISAELERLKTEINLSSEEKIEQTKASLQEAKALLNELNTKKSILESRINDFNNKIALSEIELSKAENANKSFNPILLITAIIVMALCAVAIPISLFLTKININYVLAFGGAAIAILTPLSFVLKPKNKSLLFKLNQNHNLLLSEFKTEDEKLNNITSKIETVSEKISILSSAVETDELIKSSRASDFSLKSELIDREKEKLNFAQKDLDDLVNRISPTINKDNLKETIDRLVNKAEELKNIRLRLNYLINDLGDITYDEAKYKLSSSENAFSPDDFELAKRNEEILSSKRNELISQISAAITELKTAFNSSENPETVRREVNELKSTLISQKQFCDAADLACDTLIESFAEIRRGYGSALEEKALNILSQLTSGKYKGMNISKSLDIMVEPSETFGTREVDYLSKGTADQAYLSLRLAVSELLSEEETVPIILDDVLSQYDDTRLRKAIEFLKEYSLNSQAILFTCHNAVCEVAKANNIECKAL